MPEHVARDRAERAAINQSLFREVNERLEEVMSKLSMFHDFICECADPACTKTVSLTHDEYQTLRTSPIQFAVLPGHVLPDVERVVGANERYEIVEKVGRAGEVASGYARRGDAG